MALLNGRMGIKSGTPRFGILTGSLSRMALTSSGKRIHLVDMIPSVSAKIYSTRAHHFGRRTSGLSGIGVLAMDISLPFTRGH